MASIKFIAISLAVLFLCLSGQTQTASAADTCTSQLETLVSCAASVVPGASAGPPSKQCCSALRGVTHQCACNTLNIINSLPAKCGLSTIKCSAKVRVQE
ncbi:hypothetical protein LUZ60_011809 [Juncus effusus]|nr:hypothetical protein LUZ60_011809 [Juncus effusus]